VAGLIADRTGYGSVFLIGAGGAVCGLAIALYLRRTTLIAPPAS